MIIELVKHKRSEINRLRFPGQLFKCPDRLFTPIEVLNIQYLIDVDVLKSNERLSLLKYQHRRYKFVS